MALIKCPECGKDVSDKAAACIHCGYPLAESVSSEQEKVVKILSSAYAAPKSVAPTPTPTNKFLLFSADNDHVYRVGGDEFDELAKEADSMMYENKKIMHTTSDLKNLA